MQQVTTLLSQSDGNALSALQECPTAVEPDFRQVALPHADVDTAVIAPLHAEQRVTPYKVIGRRERGTNHATSWPASEKRHGTKSLRAQ